MRKVYYIPRDIAKKIKDPVNLISICGPYDSHPDFKQNHNLLYLRFSNFYRDMPEPTRQHLIDDEQIEKIIEYATAVFAKGEDIFVHCGEGSIRSPAIATFISHLADYGDGELYMPSSSYAGHRGSDHHMCRETFNRCVEFHTKKVTEGKVLIAIDQLRAKIEVAGLAYSAVVSVVDDYRIDGKRQYIESEVDEAIKRIAEGVAALTGEGGKNPPGGVMMDLMKKSKLNTAPRADFNGVKDTSEGEA